MKTEPFSISLPVQHIDMSLAFYESLGFDLVEGGHARDYAVLQNGKLIIGLYHGMSLLPKATIKTGWDPRVEPIKITANVSAL